MVLLAVGLVGVLGVLLSHCSAWPDSGGLALCSAWSGSWGGVGLLARLSQGSARLGGCVGGDGGTGTGLTHCSARPGSLWGVCPWAGLSQGSAGLMGGIGRDGDTGSRLAHCSAWPWLLWGWMGLVAMLVLCSARPLWVRGMGGGFGSAALLAWSWS